MRRLIALSFVSLIAAAAVATVPAAAEPGKKTDLVELGGRNVDTLPMRYNFEAAWVVDNQNVLYRDVHYDYYLVTLKSACQQIEVRGRRFVFFPDSPQLFASRGYQIRPEAGPRCHVAKIEQVDDSHANTLRDKSQRRVW